MDMPRSSSTDKRYVNITSHVKLRHLADVFWILITLTGWPAIGSANNQLPDEIANAIKQSGFNQDGIGLFIQAVDAVEPLVEFQADTALNPASVIKLVTTAAALGILGSGYRWSTDVWYTGNIEDDTLEGNLYFRGNGDPYLTPERFWRLLNRVSIFGIRHINGNIGIDNTYFKSEPVNYAAFDAQPYRTYHVGPNALLVGFQATEFHFAVVNQQKQEKLQITPFPASPKLQILNNVKLTNGRCGAWQKRLSLSTRSVDGILQVSFGGRYALNCDDRTLYRRVTETQDHFQHYFLPLWYQLGNTLKGDIKLTSVPDNAKPAIKEASISLSEAIRLINKFSNNVMTRQLLLSMGAQSLGPPGTPQKGIQVVKSWLAEQKLGDPALQLDNGAGLSRNTRISAAQLGQLLHYVFQQPYMPEFIASLPVSGYDGTMAHRFTNEPLQGHAHIKTGLLDFVQSMAGYITTATGKRYVVVLLQNHPRAHTKAGERLQDHIIRWIFALNSE